MAYAVVDAGAIRLRPLLLTVLAMVVGPSLLISTMAVPVMYYMLNSKTL